MKKIVLVLAACACLAGCAQTTPPVTTTDKDGGDGAALATFIVW